MQDKIWVEHFEENDLAYRYMYEKAAVVIQNFGDSYEFQNINDVIEIYESSLYCENEKAYLTRWTEKERKECVKKAGQAKKRILEIFARHVTDDTLECLVGEIVPQYIQRFWRLFIQLDCKIKGSVLVKVLNEHNICFLLLNKKIVKRYDKILGDFLRDKLFVACLLMDSEVVGRYKYYYPDSISDLDKFNAISKYIDSDEADINALKLWSKAPESISYLKPDIRLKAQKKAEKLTEKIFSKKNNSVRCEIKVAFSDSITDVKHTELLEKEKGIFGSVLYNVRWFKKHLDYSTILNNILYFFDFVDWDYRCLLTKEYNKMSVLEECMRWFGKDYYKHGTVFDTTNRIMDLELRMYVDFLNFNGISLENLFKWYFEEYLAKEFGVKGFTYNVTSGTNVLDKCIMLGREIDHIYKQWDCYSLYEEVDEEIIKLSSRIPSEDKLNSLVSNKYVYLSNDCSTLRQEIFLLFSDQSLLTYTNKTQSKYSCFFEMILKERMYIDDFKDCQIERIRFLNDNEDVDIKDGVILFNFSKVRILKELFDHTVICYRRKEEDIRIYIDEMVKRGQLYFSCELFSKPEQEYVCYLLNNKFSNGLQIKNQYKHGSNSSDRQVIERDYFVLLRVTLLLIFKINDEMFMKFIKKDADISFDMDF